VLIRRNRTRRKLREDERVRAAVEEALSSRPTQKS
jgi:hypothetical protein